MCISTVVGAQTVVPAAQTNAPARTSNAADAGLQRVIAIHLENVTLKAALKTVGQLAGTVISYSAAEVPITKHVSLVADKITVKDALNVLLQDTETEAVGLRSGFIAIWPVGTRPAAPFMANQQGTAVITGYVRDSATGASIQQAAVRVDGTTIEVKSGPNGEYKITGLAAGDYRVTARRVGFLAKTRTASVTDGSVKNLDFGLNPPATQLNEVVTTALGDQRRYEVGNAISSINVDSIAPNAPVTSVTDLIEGRAPGVEVIESSGLVGGGEAIRIRGESSLLTQGDPILIVDGVRQDNAAGGLVSTSGWYQPSPSRLNDIDFSQIETIDVLKGPAASTEYGTDAANGVIVITTKRGQTGSPRWHASAEQGLITPQGKFPEYYEAWGHLTNGTAQGNTGGLFNGFSACPLYYATYRGPSVLYGNCVVDSVSHFNPLNHAATTMYGTGPSSKYDLDISGGSETIRYYFAGGLANATGNTHMPDVFLPEARALGYPASDFKPNGLDQRSAKANMSVKLSSTADVQLNITYTTTYQEAPDIVNIGQGTEYSPPIDDSVHFWGWGDAGFSPLATLGQTSNQQNNALDGGFTTTWRPTGWLTTHLILGVQHESQSQEGALAPQAQEYSYGGTGYLTLSNGSNDVYTVDWRSMVTAAILPSLKSTTSLGVQAVRNTSNSIAASGANLTAGSFNLASTTQPYAQQAAFSSGTLGGYLEEQLGFNDRLFLTGALRIDAGSGFGSHYNVQPYEKASVSWLALNDGPTTVRLRGALGGAGIEPPYGAALQTFSVQNVYTPSGAGQGYTVNAPGNLNLQPERTLEYEGGVDVGLWRNRVEIEVTAYSKTTQNAIYSLPLGFDFGYLTDYENLGEVHNSGLEETVTANILQQRDIDWSVTVDASVNTNKLVHLNGNLQTTPQGQPVGPFNQFFSEGYPLYGFWGERVRYTDVNHDGILEPNEMSYDTALSYMGSAIPKEETSLSTHLGLWHDALNLGALFDYRTGFKVVSIDAEITSQIVADSYAENHIGGPLWQQAQAYLPTNYQQPSTTFEDGSFLRFRELNATVNLPHQWARSAHVANLSLTGAVRNLALWTTFQGDPEATSTGGYGTSYQPSTASSFVNNDTRQAWGSIPLMRTWMVRLNVGL